MTKKIVTTLVLLLSVFTGLQAMAQQDRAYFYIEGDLETPIYLKIEGEMQPRYGENHFIINNLGEGYTKFQILFQQNIYPPQNFLLYVPKGGFRGFSLKKVDQNKFALYDLQQKRFILAGNSKKDDPVFTPKTVAENPIVTTSTTAVEAPADMDLPAFVPQEEAVPKKKEKRIAQKVQQKEKTPPNVKTKQRRKRSHNDRLPLLDEDTTLNLGTESTRAVTKDETTSIPIQDTNNFIPGVVLNNNQSSTTLSNSVSSQIGCTTPIDNDAFQDFATTYLGYANDFDKIKYLKRGIKGKCFSTAQVQILGMHLDMQSSRLEVLKMLYPQTTDKENYKILKDLFNTKYLKDQFEQSF